MSARRSGLQAHGEPVIEKKTLDLWFWLVFFITKWIGTWEIFSARIQLWSASALFNSVRLADFCCTCTRRCAHIAASYLVLCDPLLPSWMICGSSKWIRSWVAISNQFVQTTGADFSKARLPRAWTEEGRGKQKKTAPRHHQPSRWRLRSKETQRIVRPHSKMRSPW